MTGLALSPDGRLIGLAGFDTCEPAEYSSHARVVFCEVDTGRLVTAYQKDRGGIRCIGFAPDGKTVVTGDEDGTALIWPTPGRAAGGKRNGKLDEARLERLWANLARSDAALAWQEMAVAAGGGDQVVAFLGARLHAVPRPAADALTRLVPELDDPRFAVREAAENALAAVGSDAAAPLRAALQAKMSAEGRRRVERLLGRMRRTDLVRTYPIPAERLRELRAILILEWIGSPEACRALARLAEGASVARQTWEAQAALARLRRPPGQP
jgi:hypothetical protein